MEEMFKLKVCIGETNIELEGVSSTVMELFSDLREHGLGKLAIENNIHSGEMLQTEKGSTQEITAMTKDNVTVSAETDAKVKATVGFPTIKDVVIKELPKTEAEWILVYAFYLNKEGKYAFTADDIREMYQSTSRFNESRRKNFASNLKKTVVSNWFSSINDSEYELTDEGKENAMEILHRQPEASKQRTKKSSLSESYQMVELGLDPEQREKLKSYINSFENLPHMEESLLIASWLKSNKNILEVDANTIFSVLRTVGRSTSFDIKASLSNAKIKKNYLMDGSSAGMYQLHHIGEDRVTELENGRN